MWDDKTYEKTEDTVMVSDTQEPPRKKLGKATRLRLLAVLDEGARLDALAKQTEQRLDELKQEARSLVEKHRDALEHEAASYYFAHGPLRLVVTYPEPTPEVDFEKLRGLVGDEVFRGIAAPTGYKLDMNLWRQACDLELCTAAQLADCLLPPKPRKASVAFRGGADGS